MIQLSAIGSITHTNIATIRDSLVTQNLILVGAPCVGKTEALKNHTSLDIVDSLKNLEVTADAPVVIDDFYDLFMDHQTGPGSDAFERLLRNRQTGLCLVIRPRSLEWLVNNTELTEYIDLSSFEHRLFRYSRQDAAETCWSEFEDFRSEELTEYGDFLSYEYDVDINNTLTYEYSTLLPYLLEDARQLHQGPEIADEMGLKENIISKTREALTETIRIESQMSIRQSISGLDQTGIPLLGLIGGPAASFALAFAFALMFDNHHGRITPDELTSPLQELLQQSTLPHKSAELEAEFGLPPKTFENLWRILDPTHREHMTHLLDQFDNLDQLESELQSHADELKDINDRLTTLEQATEGSLRSIETLEQTLLDEQANVLDVPPGTTEAIDRQRYQPNSSDASGVDIDASQAAEELLDEQSIIVLRGSHGTGKTTFAYDLGLQLQDRDTELVIPNLRQRAYLPVALRRREAPPVLFVSFFRGPGAFEMVDQLRQLLQTVRDGLAQGLVIECRSERFGTLKQTLRDATEDQNWLSEAWQEHLRIDFDLLESESAIREIATAALEQKGVSESKIETALPEIVRIAEGNPEIAKIAARVAAESDSNLSTIAEEEDLILAAIQGIFDGGLQETVFEYLSTVGSMRRADIKQLFDLMGKEMRDLESNLQGYLTETDDPPWWIVTPEIYGHVVFRTRCLDGLDAYVEDFVDESLYRYYPSIAGALVTANDTASDSDTSGVRVHTARQSKTLLQAIADDATETEARLQYVYTVATLTRGGIRLDLAVLKRTIDTHLLGARTLATRIDTTPKAVIATSVTPLLRTAYESVDQFETYHAKVQNLITVIRTRAAELDIEVDSLELRAILSATAIVTIVASEDADNDDAVALVESIVDESWTAVEGGIDQAKSHLLILMSHAVSGVASESAPTAVDEWLPTLVRYYPADLPEEHLVWYLRNLYGMTFVRIIAALDPANANEWMQTLRTYLRDTAKPLTANSEKLDAVVLGDTISHVLDQVSGAEVHPSLQLLISDIVDSERKVELTGFFRLTFATAAANIVEEVDVELVAKKLSVLHVYLLSTTEAVDPEPVLFVENIYAEAMEQLARDTVSEESEQQLVMLLRAAQTLGEELGDDRFSVAVETGSIAISFVAEETDFDAVDDWLEIFVFVLVLFEETQNYERGDLVTAVLGRGLARIANRSTSSVRVGWLDGLLSVFDETSRQLIQEDIDESDQLEPWNQSALVLALYHDLFSRTVVNLANWQSSGECDEWLDELESELIDITRDTTEESPLIFPNLYATTFSSLAFTYDLSEAVAWAEYLIDRLEGHCQTEDGSEKRDELQDAYKTIFEMLTRDDNPTASSEWLHWVAERVCEPAERLDGLPEQFLFEIVNPVIMSQRGSDSMHRAMLWYEVLWMFRQRYDTDTFDSLITLIIDDVVDWSP